jgi:hypothetical protein
MLHHRRLKHKNLQRGIPYPNPHRAAIGTSNRFVWPTTTPRKAAKAIPKETNTMGKRRESSMLCLAPNPAVIAPPAGDGQNENEICPKGLIIPVENVAIGEVLFGGRRSG